MATMSRAGWRATLMSAVRPPRTDARRPSGAAPVLVWACYAVLAAVLVGYFVWLLARHNDGFSVPIDGWLVAGTEVAAGLLCLVRAFNRRGQDRVTSSALAVSLFAWAFGDIAFTVQSLGGATPPLRRRYLTSSTFRFTRSPMWRC
jgi:peptidoglycan/LPS O-acetylase OafA/YrhL